MGIGGIRTGRRPAGKVRRFGGLQRHLAVLAPVGPRGITALRMQQRNRANEEHATALVDRQFGLQTGLIQCIITTSVLVDPSREEGSLKRVDGTSSERLYPRAP